METLFSLEAPAPPHADRHTPEKTNGVHYTPSGLAGFVARRLLAHLGAGPAFVLDPACGDGELLLALAMQAKGQRRPAPHLVGVDRDPAAITAAQDRLERAPAATVTLRCGDFLEAEPDLLAGLPIGFDAIISNPPYVRTQVLGAARAQGLARQFALTGRVDLYHAFVAAMTLTLRQGGILGLLCSNRFLQTRGGKSMRALLLGHYELAELWDLGDSKLFEAAVLPAVLVARREEQPADGGSTYVRVYEDDSDEPANLESSLLTALERGSSGVIQVGGRRFNIERGALAERTAERPWRLVSPSGSRWLRQVQRHASGRLGDLGPIRVGVKTTADSVFIRPSWDDLPAEQRPEDELIHPLLTHRVASRWTASEDDPAAKRFLLYPHEIRDGRRRAVDLSRFPRTRTYLERHRTRLEGREYVRKAGREWYEIWVPQQPDAWAERKIVWPDIADRPRFFLDTTGSIVNGDCYWLRCGGVEEEEIALALAVANSSFALRYYDLCCGNRLYAGRRRFITQYLEELPIPAASSVQLRDIAVMVAKLGRTADTQGSKPDAALEGALDNAITELFGLKEVGREP